MQGPDRSDGCTNHSAGLITEIDRFPRGAATEELAIETVPKAATVSRVIGRDYMSNRGRRRVMRHTGPLGLTVSRKSELSMRAGNTGGWAANARAASQFESHAADRIGGMAFRPHGEVLAG